MESRLTLKNSLKHRRYLVSCHGKQFASIRHAGLFFGFNHSVVYRKISKWLNETRADLSKSVISTRITVSNMSGDKEFKLNIRIHNEEYAV